MDNDLKSKISEYGRGIADKVTETAFDERMWLEGFTTATHLLWPCFDIMRTTGAHIQHNVGTCPVCDAFRELNAKVGG